MAVVLRFWLMVVGAFTPMLLVDLTHRRQLLWVGVMFAMVTFVYVSIRAVARSNESFKYWCRSSRIGPSITGFCGAVLSSTLATMLVALPIPFWACVIVSGLLVLAALMLVLAD